MAKVIFKTKSQENIEIDNLKIGAKLLAVAVRSKQDIRYGCSSGKCGTCAVKVTSGTLSEMEKSEYELLKKMGILDDAKVRLACRARLESEEINVDLNFQETYDPTSFGF